MRIKGASSFQFSGCQLCCTVLNTLSGCGIIIVTLPSVEVRDEYILDEGKKEKEVEKNHKIIKLTYFSISFTCADLFLSIVLFNSFS